jgi:hypothetical protein
MRSLQKFLPNPHNRTRLQLLPSVQPTAVATVYYDLQSVTMGKPKQKINEEVTLNKYVAKDRSDSERGSVCWNS